MKIYDIAKNFAERNGLIAGICDAYALSDIEDVVISKKTPFVSKDISRRIDPKKSLKDAESIIVIGVNYNKKFDFDCSDNKDLRGKISIYAAQEDYHIVLRRLLEELVEEISLRIGDFKYKILVDGSGLIEKELAVKAGLGFYGKNSLVISEQFGSFFFIGVLITDIAMEIEQPESKDRNNCGSCMKCVNHCPTSALGADGQIFDYAKCISYITQKKDILSSTEKMQIGNHLYGCDICQIVCPFNNDESLPFDTINDIDLVRPKVSEIIDISDKGFDLKFGHTAIRWAGADVLRRNAAIITRNKGIKSKSKGENNK